MSSSARRSEAPLFFVSKNLSSSLDRADEDVRPYVVRGGSPRTSIRSGSFQQPNSQQLFSTQSAPAATSSVSLTVVRKAITLAPDALPARMPAGTSSTTTQSVAENPRTEAPFRYGSG